MVFKLAEFLSPRRDKELWRLIAQCGVTDVVAIMSGAEQERRMFASVAGAIAPAVHRDRAPWSEAALARDQKRFAEAGFRVVALEDTPPMDRIRLGLPGRDDDIEALSVQLRAMGNLGIDTLCYNWMAVSSWSRTSSDTRGRGGALVTAFDAHAARELGDFDLRSVDAEQMWENFFYFLDAILPIAEKAGVRLGLHPDDPPIPVLRGVPRIMGTADSFRRVVAYSRSVANGVTFCQANFSLMGDPVPALIREFAERIVFVHFRNVRGSATDFVETFHDEGDLDMAACMRAYMEIGFSGPLRPDHVPTMAGEPNDRPGYEKLGRIFALGYIKGLAHAMNDMAP